MLNQFTCQLLALPACLEWSKNALEEFPQRNWFSALCEKFHEFHNKSEAGAAASNDAIETLLTEFSGGEGDYSDAPSWMTSSENDKYIKSLCVKGMHL